MAAIAGIAFRAVCNGCGRCSPVLKSPSDGAARRELYDLGWTWTDQPSGLPESHSCPSCNGLHAAIGLALSVSMGGG